MAYAMNKNQNADSDREINVTERGKERAREDEDFLPVIIKRTDEARRHPDDILQTAIVEGLEQLNRPAFSLLLSSIAGGMMLGFSALAVAVITMAGQSLDSPWFLRIATALVYPLGFIICLMSGTELFTEHTATAVYPVLDQRSSIMRLLRLWGIVISGNLIGALIASELLVQADQVVRAGAAYIEIARRLVSFGNVTLLFSAILAGWLMAIGAWLILATPPTSSQMGSIYIVTFLIGLGGLHHSIAGSVEMFVGFMLGSEFTVFQTLRFLALAFTGNLIGGSVFVALLNYGHIRGSQSEKKI